MPQLPLTLAVPRSPWTSRDGGCSGIAPVVACTVAVTPPSNSSRPAATSSTSTACTAVRVWATARRGMPSTHRSRSIMWMAWIMSTPPPASAFRPRHGESRK